MNQEKLQRLTEFCLNGDDQAAWKLIMQLVEGKDCLFFYEEVLGKVMRDVGDLWEMNAITVADEHIASNVCHLLLSRYLNELGVGEEATVNTLRPKAMLFCVEGEQHTLGIKMVSAVFKENGWETRNLGANLPVRDAVLYANRWRPDVIGVSAAILYHLPALNRLTTEIRKLSYKPEIIIGGRTTSLCELEVMNQTTIVKDLYTLQRFIDENKLCKKLSAVN